MRRLALALLLLAASEARAADPPPLQMCAPGQIAFCATPAFVPLPEPPEPNVPVPPVPPPKPPAGVLFSENFEGPNPFSDWTETTKAAQVVCDIVEQNAHSGKCYLLVDQPAFGWGGELGKDLGTWRDQLYVSFWWKFPDMDTIPPHTAGGHFWRLGGQLRAEPQFDTQTDGNPPKLTLISDWVLGGKEIPYFGVVAPPVGRWFRFEFFYRLNTPGKADGVVQAWVDGALAFEKTGQIFRPSEKEGIRFLRFVTNYDNCPSKTGCRWFYDDLEVRASRP